MFSSPLVKKLGNSAAPPTTTVPRPEDVEQALNHLIANPLDKNASTPVEDILSTIVASLLKNNNEKAVKDDLQAILLNILSINETKVRVYFRNAFCNNMPKITKSETTTPRADANYLVNIITILLHKNALKDKISALEK